MRRVERPMWEPYRCAFTLKAEDPEGFIVGETIKGFDPHAFVAVSWVKQTAKELGMFTQEEYAELAALADERDRRVADLTEQLAEADKLISAIDVLESAQFTTRRKTGRPKTRQEA